MLIFSFERRSVARGFALGAILLLAPSQSQAVDIAVSGIEVTQAIQNYDVSDPTHPNNNSNTLVAGNHTAARVYVTVTNTTVPVTGVTALMTVLVDDVIHSVIGPDAPGEISAPLVPDPDNQNHSLNFTLPIDLEMDTDVDLQVELDPMNTIVEDDETNNVSMLNDLSFECRETPEIVYTAVNYNAPDETDPTTLGLPDPSRTDPGIGDDFIFGIFPFPDDRFRYHEAAFSPLPWNINIDDSFDDFLNWLEDCRQTIDPMPKFLYAWFKENPYNGNGRAISIPGNVAFGNTQIVPDRGQRTFAHEMGHLFGLFHNFRDIAPDTGWDVENLMQMGEVKTGDKYDILYPGLLTPQAWIDDITYEFLLDSDCFACEGDIGGIKKPYPYLTAVVGVEPGEATLGPVFEFPRYTKPSVSVPGGRVLFQALNSRGRVIEQIATIPNFESEAGEEVKTAPIAVTFSALEDLQVIQLVEGERVTARRVRSPNAPQLLIESPKRGQTLEGPFAVSWQARDPDGDQLTFMVQYSSGYDREGRQLWVPLEVNQKGTRIVADTKYLAGSRDASVRVIASDGFNTTLAEVSGLSLPVENAPKIKIVGNKTSEYQEGSLVILQASVYDREDGILTDEEVLWTSNRDGALSKSATLQTANLSPGAHRLTVRATDTSGLTSEDHIEINILPSSLAKALKSSRLEARKETP